MPANDNQVGGDHYKKMKIAHWDFVEANGIPYLEACAIKYLTRWRDKGGVEDLRKAIHFIEKRIELEETKKALEASNPYLAPIDSLVVGEWVRCNYHGCVKKATHICNGLYLCSDHEPALQESKDAQASK